MSDKLFLLLVMLFMPFVRIDDKEGKTRLAIWGALFYLLDYIAKTLRATFGGGK